MRRVMSGLYCIKFLSKNKQGWDGDFSNFDGRKMGCVLWSVLDVINRWYDDGPINCRVRSILWEEVVQSYHVTGNVVYEWTASLASGLFGTTGINTMENEILHVIVMYREFQSVDFMLCYEEHIVQEFTGDDNITTVSDDIISRFNFMTVKRGMESMGYKYTVGAKDENDYISKPVGELKFLKRGFRLNEIYGGYDAPIELSTIFTALDFMKKGHYGYENLAITVTEMVLELSMHGKEIFDQYANSIVEEHFETTRNYVGVTDYNVALLLRKERSQDFQWGVLSVPLE